MIENESKDNRGSERSFWSTIALSLSAMISSVAGSKFPGHYWLMYLAGLTLVVALLLILWQSPPGSYVREWFSKVRTKSILRRADIEYREIIERMGLLPELRSALEDLDWGDRTPRGPLLLENSLLLMNDQYDWFPKSARVVAANFTVKEVFDSYDSWLSECDGMMRKGIKYKSEQHHNKVLQLLRKYGSFIEDHNKFCRSVNIKRTSVKLLSLYKKDHNFNWKASTEDV